MSRDPIGEEAGGKGAYQILANSSLTSVDYLGLMVMMAVLPPLQLPCCGGIEYSPATSCCCDNFKIEKRGVKKTGVRRCVQMDRGAEFGPITLNGLTQHAWLEYGAKTNAVGFYPIGNTVPEWFVGTQGYVNPEDSYGGNRGRHVVCDELILSPCEYDFSKIEQCLSKQEFGPPQCILTLPRPPKVPILTLPRPPKVPIFIGHPGYYYLGIYDCRHWSQETLDYCTRAGKRKCK